MQVSVQQQELKLTVEQMDYDAAVTGWKELFADGWCNTSRDPIALAFCRQFGVKSGTVSVGMNRIHVFDGDAAEDKLVATYRLDDGAQRFIARYDLGQPVALPLEVVATLEEIERKKAKGDYGSYDVIEYPTEPEPEPGAGLWAEPEPEPIIVGADA